MNTSAAPGDDPAKKRKTSTPPEGYVCNVCNTAGHWIQQCPNKKRSSKRQKSNHVPVAGVDPSQTDIEEAREMQKITPPRCFCRIPSRLKKVKRSKEGGESSRAIGKYFFFCSKGKRDRSKCRFARPVEDEMKPKMERLCAFFAKTGNCKKGDKCVFSHDLGLLKQEQTVTSKPKSNPKPLDDTTADNHVNNADNVSSTNRISDDNNEKDSSSSSSSSSSRGRQ
mmetsp:Transcript_19051/g.28345  ORF Transcript_19051/g.28345 Transcript_19051/m.28345 type:complete len:224 (-) Transcript_19051:3818-4489(-)